MKFFKKLLTKARKCYIISFLCCTKLQTQRNKRYGVSVVKQVTRMRVTAVVNLAKLVCAVKMFFNNLQSISVGA